MADTAPTATVDPVAAIVSASVANDNVGAADPPDLLRSVHDALGNLLNPPPPAPEETPEATAVQIKKSITSDALISFVDGRPYKSLKRHLTKHGMTTEDYRAKFGLPLTHPVAAESYSAARSELAKCLGLGQIRRGRAAAKAIAPDAAE